MGCTEPVKGIKESIETMEDASNLQSQLLNDDGLSSMLELHISCKNLKLNSERIDHTIIVVYSSTKAQKFSEVGKTEIVPNNQTQTYVKSIILRYLFEERQKIKFELHQALFNNSTIGDSSLIGSCIMEPHEIVRAPKQEFSRAISSKNSNTEIGELVVYADSLSKKMSANQIFIEFEGVVKKKGFYFIKLYRQKEIDSPNFLPVFQSETQLSTNEIIKWKKIKVGAASLIKDDFHSNIKIEFLLFSRNGNHKIIAEKICEFQSFMNSKPVINSTKEKGIYIKTLNVVFEERFSFVEYLFGGLNIAMILAIDFTGSNKDPSLPDSLHYFDPGKNQYLSAITSVGTILECYDTDKMIPVLGFGARIQQTGQITSHCFALNGNIFEPEVYGIKGVVDTYRNNLMKLNFAGPTHFSPVLNYVSTMVEEYVKKGISNTFFVLMIITDGEIHDIPETIDEIVKCSSLPIAIIIVGVGDEDFKNMEILDADEVPLVSKKYGKMKSDIVQFVPLKQYLNNPQELASETLQELPRQVSDYMKSINANPKSIRSNESHEPFNYFEKKKNEYLNSFNDPNQKDAIFNAVQIGVPSLEREFLNEYCNTHYFNTLITKNSK